MVTDVIIVGSGTAGSAMAYALARDGYKVTVIERWMEPPERIVGEILHAGGIDALKELGMQDCLGHFDSVPIWGISANDYRTGRHAVLKFPDGVRSISCFNAKLVKALREKAMREEKCTYIEGSVMEVIEEDTAVKGVIFKRKGNETTEKLEAKLTVIADGPFSKLRKVNMDSKPVKQGTWITFTFKADIRSHPPPACTPPADCNDAFCLSVYFIGDKDNSVVLSQLNNDTLRYTTNVYEPWPKDEREFIKRQLCDLPEYVRAPILACIDTVHIDRSHIHELHTGATYRAGVITIGDALNIRHPCTGAGMTVGLKDVVTWRGLLRSVPRLTEVRSMRAAHEGFMKTRRAYTMSCNINARAFQDVMFPTNSEKLFSRSCILDYLIASEKARDDLSKVLAIKDTRPLMLLYHLGMATMLTAYKAARHSAANSGAAIWQWLPAALLGGATVLYRSTRELIPILWTEVRIKH